MGSASLSARHVALGLERRLRRRGRDIRRREWPLVLSIAVLQELLRQFIREHRVLTFAPGPHVARQRDDLHQATSRTGVADSKSAEIEPLNVCDPAWPIEISGSIHTDPPSARQASQNE